MNFRRTIALLSAGIIAAGVMAGTGITTMAAETISDAQAKAIALEDGGLSADQVTCDRIDMGTEQGASVYEIEFKTGSMEYDYDVAVADGEIVEESWEIRRPSASGNQISEAGGELGDQTSHCKRKPDRRGRGKEHRSQGCRRL